MYFTCVNSCLQVSIMLYLLSNVCKFVEPFGKRVPFFMPLGYYKSAYIDPLTQ